MEKTNRKKFAFVMGRIEPAKEKAAIEKLLQLGSIGYAQRTFGKFDFIAKMHFSDFKSFFESYLQLKHISGVMPQKILLANSASEKLEKCA